MSKKHFVALADAIKEHNGFVYPGGRNTEKFTGDQLETLAGFLASQNPRFNRERWLGYIAGENGPNGGAVRK